ncbi:N-formylglutamate amidohydrolase [Rhizobiaceae bacterium]|nr:N-formylglutamate amidohydrolase [Rhizobiaceae bacterium]
MPTPPPPPKPDDAPHEAIAGNDAAGLLILCDHATNQVPERYGSLGLPAGELERHIGFDPGARALTFALAERLGAPALLSTYSRLLVDPNRSQDDPTLVMKLSDGTVVPANHPITDEEVGRRVERYHAPYHAAVDARLDAMLAAGPPPLVFSIHSFTPVWRGVPRPWHAAVLWDADPRANVPMVEALRADASLTVGDNEPYEGALFGDTIHRHATVRGLSNCLIEVRQDLIGHDAGVEEWADRFAPILRDLLNRPEIGAIRHYGSRTDGTARTEPTHG